MLAYRAMLQILSLAENVDLFHIELWDRHEQKTITVKVGLIEPIRDSLDDLWAWVSKKGLYIYIYIYIHIYSYLKEG